ncbi:MAG: GIY-YIG nuclease family protein [Minisyncoccota bacterium]
MYKVYILRSSKDGSHYTGVTEDLTKRLEEHNAGNSKYSSSKAPYNLVWYCVFKDKIKALDFEKYLKHGSGHAFARKRLV